MVGGGGRRVALPLLHTRSACSSPLPRPPHPTTLLPRPSAPPHSSHVHPPSSHGTPHPHPSVQLTRNSNRRIDRYAFFYDGTTHGSARGDDTCPHSTRSSLTCPHSTPFPLPRPHSAPPPSVYKPTRWWWEIYESLRRVACTGVLVLLPTRSVSHSGIHMSQRARYATHTLSSTPPTSHNVLHLASSRLMDSPPVRAP